jgi:hypothetical protein
MVRKVGKHRVCRGSDNIPDVNRDFLRAVFQQTVHVTQFFSLSSAPVKEPSQKQLSSQFLRYNYFFMIWFKEVRASGGLLGVTH